MIISDLTANEVSSDVSHQKSILRKPTDNSSSTSNKPKRKVKFTVPPKKKIIWREKPRKSVEVVRHSISNEKPSLFFYSPKHNYYNHANKNSRLKLINLKLKNEEVNSKSNLVNVLKQFNSVDQFGHQEPIQSHRHEVEDETVGQLQPNNTSGSHLSILHHRSSLDLIFKKKTYSDSEDYEDEELDILRKTENKSKESLSEDFLKNANVTHHQPISNPIDLVSKLSNLKKSKISGLEYSGDVNSSTEKCKNQNLQNDEKEYETIDATCYVLPFRNTEFKSEPSPKDLDNQKEHEEVDWNTCKLEKANITSTKSNTSFFKIPSRKSVKKENLITKYRNSKLITKKNSETETLQFNEKNQKKMFLFGSNHSKNNKMDAVIGINEIKDLVGVVDSYNGPKSMKFVFNENTLCPTFAQNTESIEKFADFVDTEDSKPEYLKKEESYLKSSVSESNILHSLKNSQTFDSPTLRSFNTEIPTQNSSNSRLNYSSTSNTQPEDDSGSESFEGKFKPGTAKASIIVGSSHNCPSLSSEELNLFHMDSTVHPKTWNSTKHMMNVENTSSTNIFKFPAPPTSVPSVIVTKHKSCSDMYNSKKKFSDEFQRSIQGYIINGRRFSDTAICTFPIEMVTINSIREENLDEECNGSHGYEVVASDSPKLTYVENNVHCLNNLIASKTTSYGADDQRNLNSEENLKEKNANIVTEIITITEVIDQREDNEEKLPLSSNQQNPSVSTNSSLSPSQAMQPSPMISMLPSPSKTTSNISNDKEELKKKRRHSIRDVLNRFNINGSAEIKDSNLLVNNTVDGVAVEKKKNNFESEKYFVTAELKKEGRLKEFVKKRLSTIQHPHNPQQLRNNDINLTAESHRKLTLSKIINRLKTINNNDKDKSEDFFFVNDKQNSEQNYSEEDLLSNNHSKNILLELPDIDLIFNKVEKEGNEEENLLNFKYDGLVKDINVDSKFERMYLDFCKLDKGLDFVSSKYQY